jgi:hypothetical protein
MPSSLRLTFEDATYNINTGGNRRDNTIPFHDELYKGTIKAIYRQALRYLPLNE